MVSQYLLVLFLALSFEDESMHPFMCFGACFAFRRRLATPRIESLSIVAGTLADNATSLRS